jgi:hypothetical protein
MHYAMAAYLEYYSKRSSSHNPLCCITNGLQKDIENLTFKHLYLIIETLHTKWLKNPNES